MIDFGLSLVPDVIILIETMPANPSNTVVGSSFPEIAQLISMVK